MTAKNMEIVLSPDELTEMIALWKNTEVLKKPQRIHQKHYQGMYARLKRNQLVTWEKIPLEGGSFDAHFRHAKLTEQGEEAIARYRKALEV